MTDKNKCMLNNCPNCVNCTDDYTCEDKEHEEIKEPLKEKECFKINPFVAAERYEVLKKENEKLKGFIQQIAGDCRNCNMGSAVCERVDCYVHMAKETLK